MPAFLRCLGASFWIGALMILAGIIIIIVFVPTWLWVTLIGAALVIVGVLLLRAGWR